MLLVTSVPTLGERPALKVPFTVNISLLPAEVKEFVPRDYHKFFFSLTSDQRTEFHAVAKAQNQFASEEEAEQSLKLAVPPYGLLGDLIHYYFVDMKALLPWNADSELPGTEDSDNIQVLMSLSNSSVVYDTTLRNVPVAFEDLIAELEVRSPVIERRITSALAAMDPDAVSFYKKAFGKIMQSRYHSVPGVHLVEEMAASMKSSFLQLPERAKEDLRNYFPQLTVHIGRRGLKKAVLETVDLM
ncbi:hypothetical protein L596_006320 [Steinernema carpocapsae]|uniref:Uncharacterized protein n=1 Tax=Steinernema carpocapsae TaxID=34508 RepID=A0A4U8V828_STECR|nr:hypothetical protein L596_006320 [Steinernema carpocapsae]